MENEKSAIDICKEFAKDTNRSIEFSEIPYPSSVLHPVTYHRRTLYIPNNIEGTSYFLSFSDTKEFGDYSNCCSQYFLR